jgi:DNA mismatch repair ATPase MutL
MNITTTENIKEIAEQIDCGFRAFIHKTTKQILFVPDENVLTAIDLDSWDEELEQLENNFTDYYEIDKWTSSEAFETMSEFADQLTDSNLQNRLFDSLRKNKPFREFKFVIDNSGEFRQQWFDFKNKWQQDFVARQLNRLKPIDE